MRLSSIRMRLTACCLAAGVVIAACGGSSQPRSLAYSCPAHVAVGETAAVLATITGDGELPAFHWAQESADGGAVRFDAEPARFRANPLGGESSALSRREITGAESGTVTLRVAGSSSAAQLILDEETSQSGCRIAIG